MSMIAPVESFVDHGILEPVDGGTYRISPKFSDMVERHRERIESEDRSGIETALCGNEDRNELVDALVEFGAETPELVARYLAIRDRYEDATAQERFTAMMLAEQYAAGTDPTGGVPDEFLPVRGDRLEFYLSLVDLAVVYCWREDCPPCDTMRDELNSIFPIPYDKVVPFAVFGPSYSVELQEKFEVVAAPTTLFVVDGTVDSRLHGAHYTEAIETEIETLAEYR